MYDLIKKQREREREGEAERKREREWEAGSETEREGNIETEQLICNNQCKKTELTHRVCLE